MKVKLKRGDIVQVIKGKDKGKKGRILKIFREEGKVLVEGINFVKKHTRPRTVDRQGGIIQIEKPISISNVNFFCLKCSKPTRLGIKFLEDKTKVRYCKRCKEIIEEK
ncbi:MAG: 50S ribosomal protein L24 [bacterium]|nr:50S ribosomal protein L24 [bacterium]MCX7917421.1 50S ribosomal protein L24 [bacterium]MDW8163336.1 50S ribosomal protein L24 [Candidatus Omnitrophota bacterium]